VVSLDGSRRALERDRLDNIRVQSTLKEPLNLSTLSSSILELLVQTLGLLLEHLNEGVSDDLALLLGIGDALELAEEELGSVDDGEVDAEVLAEHLVDLLGLVETEDSIVDHDGVESGVRSNHKRV
jgi:3-deoxy-D-manno-octulosonate 8-phosphate phosphatase KdsC-like HAD superfamily phosphatase